MTTPLASQDMGSPALRPAWAGVLVKDLLTVRDAVDDVPPPQIHIGATPPDPSVNPLWVDTST